MANQFNRLAYALGKGGFLRILWRPVLGGSANLVVLPYSVCQPEFDPMNEDMSEADSMGRYFAPTLHNNAISVDLRRRQDPVSLDALGIRAISFVDAVVLDIGTTGLADCWIHMAVGPYRRPQDQKTHITEGFSLIGGSVYFRNTAIPAWARATEGAGGIPNLIGYVKTGVTLPTEI